MALREPLGSTLVNGYSASHRRRRTARPRPVLDINFLAPSLSTPGTIPNLSFSRASNATMFDAQGRMVWAPANLLLNSAALGTQTVSSGVSSGASFTLSFTGTGTVTLSGGGTGTLTGTGASTRVSLTFVASAGSVTVTVSGDVRNAQLERTGSKSPSSYNETGATQYYGPRLDTNPLTLAPRGLLIEPQATNILPVSSEDITTTGGWSVGNVTTAASAFPGLLGTGAFTTLTSTGTFPNACRMTPTANNLAALYGWANGQVVTLTAFMRRGTHDGFLAFDNANEGVWAYGKFTLLGAGAASVGGANSGSSVSIERISSDVYRCRLTMVYNSATNNNVFPTVGVWDGGADFFGYPSCGASGRSVNVWAVQVEATAHYTSYIPRYTANVTRAQDQCISSVAGWYSTPLASWAVEAEAIQSSSPNWYQQAFVVRDTTTNDRITNMRYEGTNQGAIEVLPGGGRNEGFYAGAIPQGFTRYAAATSSTELAFYCLNGVQGNAGLGAPTYPPTNTGNLEARVGATNANESSWNGWIRRIQWWNNRLPSATISQLGAPIQRLWTPADLGSTLALWLDADDPAFITLNGSTVSQWSDKSGYGRHATQATGSAQPGYSATALNNKPALTWTGANNIFLDTLAWTLAPNRKYASFAVAASPTWGGGNRFGRIWVSRSGYPQGYLGQGDPAGSALAIGGSGLPTCVVTGVSGANVVSNSFGTSGLAADALDVAVNGGTATVLTGNTGALGTTGVRIGADLTVANGGNTWDGQIGEVVIVSGDLSAADRQRMEGYLAWKWSLAAKLPAGHPFKNSPPMV